MQYGKVELGTLQCLLQTSLKDPFPHYEFLAWPSSSSGLFPWGPWVSPSDCTALSTREAKVHHCLGLRQCSSFPDLFWNITIPTNLKHDCVCFQYVTVKSKTSISWRKTTFMWGAGDLGWCLELPAYAELLSSMKYLKQAPENPHSKQQNDCAIDTDGCC